MLVGLYFVKRSINMLTFIIQNCYNAFLTKKNYLNIKKNIHKILLIMRIVLTSLWDVLNILSEYCSVELTTNTMVFNFKPILLFRLFGCCAQRTLHHYSTCLCFVFVFRMHNRTVGYLVPQRHQHQRC